MRMVKLNEVLRYRKQFIEIEDSILYQRCRVQLHRRGVVQRDVLPGKEIKTKKQRICATNNFIVAEMDAKFGGYGIIPPALDNAIVSSHYYLYEIDEKRLLPKYLEVIIDSGHLQEQIKAVGSTNYSRISAKEVLEYKIPCPSLTTQNGVIRFYGKCKSTNIELSTELTHQQTLLKKLRQQILQEAIEGKLTADWRKQNPDVEPASELLARICAEKAQLIKDKKIKKQKPLPPINEKEKPFDLPDGWVWCRLGEILDDLLGGYSFKSPLFKKAGTKQVLRLGNIRPYRVHLDVKPVFIDEEVATEGSNAKLKQGDLLITMTGTRGKRDYCYTVLLNESHFQNKELYLNQRVGCLRFNRQMFSYYYDYCLKNEYLLNQIFSTATGAANQANIGSTALRSWIIPIPPLPEQKAIATKVEKLLALCDQLETQITSNQIHAEQLMQAVLKEAFTQNSNAPAKAATNV